jgi:RND family efflux transporter MFP subunit
MEKKSFGQKGLVITITVIIVLILLVVLNIYRASKREVVKIVEETVIPVTVHEAKKIKMDQILDLTGSIRSKLEVDLSFKIPGKIIKDIFVETGDYVEKGQKIAVLEKDSMIAKLDQVSAALELARANSKQAETNLDVLEKDLSRLENLYRKKAVSRQKMDHMEAQVKSAIETKKLTQAQIKQAEAAYNEANIAFRDHTLVAPESGFISKRYVDKGSMSAPGFPVVRISKEDLLKIITSVTEKEFVLIKKGSHVEIKVDPFPDKIFRSAISIVSPTIDPLTRTGEVEIHIDNKEKLLRAGMFAKIRINLGQKEVTAILKDALLQIPGTGDYYLFIVEDGKAVQKNIKTGIRQGNMIEVVYGIEPGNKVIVTGQNIVKDGIAVSVEKEIDETSASGREVK